MGGVQGFEEEELGRDRFFLLFAFVFFPFFVLSREEILYSPICPSRAPKLLEDPLFGLHVLLWVGVVAFGGRFGSVA